MQHFSQSRQRAGMPEMGTLAPCVPRYSLSGPVLTAGPCNNPGGGHSGSSVQGFFSEHPLLELGNERGLHKALPLPFSPRPWKHTPILCLPAVGAWGPSPSLQEVQGLLCPALCREAGIIPDGWDWPVWPCFAASPLKGHCVPCFSPI